MKPLLSIVLPAIRPYNWQRLYHSIYLNCTRPFELILVGPYSLPIELEQHRNIKTVRDFGSPARCMNIGASVAEGKWITWSADDGIAINGGIDKCLQILERGTRVLTTKYLEAHDNIQPDSYYQLNKAYPYSPHILDSWLIFNTTFMLVDDYYAIGGCDATLFSVSCMALADLAVRWQRTHPAIGFFKEPIWKFDWTPNSTEHKPIENAQNNNDWPTYTKVHNEDGLRDYIEFNNWIDSPSIWKERFEC